MNRELWDALGIDRATLHALINMVRIGNVAEIDEDKRRVRVAFKDAGGEKSGWLSVLQHKGAKLDIKTAESHTHSNSEVTYWLPKPGDNVLVIYFPVFNGDGFVLGGL